MGARQSIEYKKNDEIDKILKKEKSYQRKELKVLLLGETSNCLSVCVY